jgi:hypothetical protein
VTVDPNATITRPFQPTASFTPSQLPTFLPTRRLAHRRFVHRQASHLPATDGPALPVDNNPAERPQYTFYVLWDYSGNQLAVDQTIQYTNLTGTTLYDLVLAVEPNLYTDSFSLETLFLDAPTPGYALDGHRRQLPCHSYWPLAAR